MTINNLQRKVFNSVKQFMKRNQDRNSNRAGTWRQELMQRPCKGAAYWFAPHSKLSQLKGLGPPTSITD